MHVAETGSTNADLLAAVAGGAEEGGWLRADRQSGGRGRLGRAWVSPAGNLHASTIVRLRPGDPPAAGLALVAGVALQQVAGDHAPVAGLRLKWPNDLMAGPAKLGGILLERAGDAVVLGFGVNLAHHPVDIGRATTSVAALTGAAPAADAFCAALADALAAWVARWRTAGLEPVRARWLERAHPRGTALSAATATGRIDGRFDGIADDGALQLRRADGVRVLVHTGDVFLV